ncbi:MAG: DNA/RNA nuclease SfsA [Clostridia bacterium]|nr:DNA/RNA nuclease SfsA [Clostridia bacterium]
MTYSNIERAVFLSRPNRFIAYCRLAGGEEIRCHVKNTGRCRELLVPGCTVLLEKSQNPNRSTLYDLIAVYKGERLINMDSTAPNRAAAELLPQLYEGCTFFRSEYQWGDSRFDFYLERGDERRLIEVKGVTLEADGHTRFPDAPTLRGLKHVEELIAARGQGIAATLLFVIQMKGVVDFSPNDETQPAFREALCRAREAGVELIAYDCTVTENSMTIRSPVPILLQ